jgi:hypothetical protein
MNGWSKRLKIRGIKMFECFAHICTTYLWRYLHRYVIDETVQSFAASHLHMYIYKCTYVHMLYICVQNIRTKNITKKFFDENIKKNDLSLFFHRIQSYAAIITYIYLLIAWFFFFRWGWRGCVAWKNLIANQIHNSLALALFKECCHVATFPVSFSVDGK